MGIFWAYLRIFWAAFASGVNMMLAPEINVNLCKAHMLSPDGKQRD